MWFEIEGWRGSDVLFYLVRMMPCYWFNEKAGKRVQHLTTLLKKFILGPNPYKTGPVA
jgi:hypothetical protein